MASVGGSPQQLRLNLGGEADVINQQPHWADLTFHSSRSGLPLRAYLQQGHAFFCDNLKLPFPDGRVDEVITNGVPINQSTWLGPGVQRSEIERVLRSGGTWRDNGNLVYKKP